MTSPTQTATQPDIHWHKPDLLRAMAEAAGVSPAGQRFMAALTAAVQHRHPEEAITPEQAQDLLERSLGQMTKARQQEPHRSGDGDLRRQHERNCATCYERLRQLLAQQHDMWVRICAALDGPARGDLAGPVMTFVRRAYPDGENCAICEADVPWQQHLDG